MQECTLWARRCSTGLRRAPDHLRGNFGHALLVGELLDELGDRSRRVLVLVAKMQQGLRTDWKGEQKNKHGDDQSTAQAVRHTRQGANVAMSGHASSLDPR